MSIKQLHRYVFRTNSGNYFVRIDRRAKGLSYFNGTFKDETSALRFAARTLESLGELEDAASVIRYFKSNPSNPSNPSHPSSDSHALPSSSNSLDTLTVSQRATLDAAVEFVNKYIYVYQLVNKQKRFKLVIGPRANHKAIAKVYKSHSECFYAAMFALKARGVALPYDLLTQTYLTFFFRR